MAVAMFTVRATITKDKEADFNRWYNEEHAPHLLRYRGAVSAKRYRSIMGEDKYQYMAVYEVQDEDPGTQVVRVWGNTAVVTALLRIKGTNKGVAFDRRLWFSDTYVRTKQGWKYVFGQASLRLPDN